MGPIVQLLARVSDLAPRAKLRTGVEYMIVLGFAFNREFEVNYCSF